MAVDLSQLIEAGIYPNADAAIQDALRVLWQERPAVRIEVAAYRYRNEDISLSKAAALAGVSFDRMKRVLAGRGIPLRLGPETIDEALEEAEVLRRVLSGA